MYRQVVFFLGIDDINGFAFANQYTGITYLTTRFGVERSVVEYYFEIGLFLLCHFTIAKYVYIVFGVVVTNKIRNAGYQFDPVACLYGCRIAGALFLLVHFGFEFVFVERQTILAE